MSFQMLKNTMTRCDVKPLNINNLRSCCSCRFKTHLTRMECYSCIYALYELYLH